MKQNGKSKHKDINDMLDKGNITNYLTQERSKVPGWHTSKYIKFGFEE